MVDDLVVEDKVIYREKMVKANPSRYHTIENHNGLIRRYGRCMHCENGSKPVPKAQIVELLKKERRFLI
jgi:hypothetical protein